MKVNRRKEKRKKERELLTNLPKKEDKILEIRCVFCRRQHIKMKALLMGILMWSLH